MVELWWGKGQEDRRTGGQKDRRTGVCFVVMAPHLDKTGKARILALLEAGMSVRDVCAKVG